MPIPAEPAIVDLKPFNETRIAELRALRMSLTGRLIPATFGVLAVVTVALGIETSTRSDSVGAVLLFILGSLAAAIGVLWFLLLWAPGLPARASNLVVTEDGVLVHFTKGEARMARWKDASSPVYLLDLRTSARKFRSANEFEQPRILLFSSALGKFVPLTIDASQLLVSIASRAGLHAERFQPGDWGSLPRGLIKMTIPLKATVVALRR